MLRTLLYAIGVSCLAATASAQGVGEPAPATRLIEALPNGGVIELQRAEDDSVGMRVVRARLRGLAQTLAQGDLAAPASTRLSVMPGVRTMVDRRNAIRYDYRELPRGAALRITTGDLVARKAIWEFVAFQRNEQMAEP